MTNQNDDISALIKQIQLRDREIEKLKKLLEGAGGAVHQIEVIVDCLKKFLSTLNQREDIEIY